jgi:hypothetical protein
MFGLIPVLEKYRYGLEAELTCDLGFF